jgi:hypothetical protein
MDIYTRDKTNLTKQDEIDVFESAIWTERYYGDDDFELNVPATEDMLGKLPRGQILMCEGSDIPMILETRDVKDGLLKTTGISLTEWLNNRIIRTTADHSVKEWVISGQKAGQALQTIVTNFAMEGSPYLDGTINIGIPTFQVVLMPVPGLSIGGTDLSGVVHDYSVPFGPVYDALKAIAAAYEIGIRITFEFAFDGDFMLQFSSYSGLDRTSGQSVRPAIRFSPEMDSFTNIRDLESNENHSNWVYTFAGNETLQALGPTAGWAWNYAPPAMGFDLRVAQVFADNIDPATVTTVASLNNILQQKANEELFSRRAAKLVDGEIVQTGQIEYGSDYFMGDIIEVEGNTGILQNARITEYIRSQDKSGERAYPGLTMID